MTDSTPRRPTALDDAALTRSFELALAARAAGDHPFGAVLVVDGEIAAEAVNRVNTGPDITAHAETELVRTLEREGRLHLLAQGVVHASCEPCPMCVGAMFWAGARTVVYGLSTARLTEIATPLGADPVGFTITAAEIGRSATPGMRIDGPWREDEAGSAHAGFWHA